MRSRGVFSVEAAFVVVCAMGIAASGYYLLKSSDGQKRAFLKEDNWGFVRPEGPDVRIRGQSDAAWNKVLRDANVFKNDRVFTGSSSSARVNLKTAQSFTVEPNSLIVISDEEKVSTIDLDQGSFLGEIKRGARLLVKSHGQEVNIESTGSTVRLSANDGKRMNLVVLKGEASVKKTEESEPQLVKANEEVEVTPAAVTVKKLSIILKRPDAGAVLWDRGAPTNFQWQTSSHDEYLELEISTDPLFKSVTHHALVDGDSKLTDLEPGNIYFWRVFSKGESSASSPTSSFSYYALKPPKLTDQQLTLAVQANGETIDPVEFSWAERSSSDSYELQIAQDSNFKRILRNEKSVESHLSLRGLHAPESYFWRVISKHPSREDLISDVATLELRKTEIPVPRTVAAEGPSPTPEPAPFVMPSPTLAPPPPEPLPVVEMPIEKEVIPALGKPKFQKSEYKFELYEPDHKPDEASPGFQLRTRPTFDLAKVDGAESYALEFSAEKNFRSPSKSVPNSIPKFQLEESQLGTYFARVVAIRGDETSVSEVVQIEVELAPPALSIEVEKAEANHLSSIFVKAISHHLASANQIQISSSPQFDNPQVKISKDSDYKIEQTSPGLKYIRARSLNAEGKPVSSYSKVGQIEIADIPRPQEDPPKVDFDEKARSKLIPGLVLWGGSGFEYTSFDQTSNEGYATGNFAKFMAPTMAVGVELGFSDRWGLNFQYNDLKGQISTASDTSVNQSSFQWKSYLIEGEYRFAKTVQSYFSALFGFQDHSTPFWIVNNDTSFSLTQIETLNLSAGLKYNYLSRSNFEYEAFMRYQQPLSSHSSDGYDFKSNGKLMFDGSLGVTKRFDSGFRLGVYWFGQYLNSTYEFNNGAIHSSGSESLLNSNVQLRLGFDFLNH